MIQLQNISKSFGSKSLFNQLTYQFPSGEKIALYGANGAGKTTLLNIICGLDQADDGQLIQPDGIRVGYLPQIANPKPQKTVLEECLTGAKEAHRIQAEMKRLTERMDSGDSSDYERFEQLESQYRLLDGYKMEAESSRILKGLGFSDSDLARSPLELSGGWRMRLELAKIFLDKPHILVLDEPTNHLDLPSLVWVERFLKNYEHTVLLVSHDRDLLNSIPTMLLHLQGGQLGVYKGNFDAFLDERERRLEEMVQQKEQLRRRREQMQRFVDRFGAKATKATQAQSRVKMIARIKDIEDAIDLPDDDRTLHYRIPDVRESGRVAFTVEGGAIGYEKPLHENIDWLIEKKHRVAIVGANGVGKSTLLKTIAGVIPPVTGQFELGYQTKLGYFDQDQAKHLNKEATVFDNLLQSGDLGQQEARSLLGAFLFSGDSVSKKVSVLSGGEKSRLGLACVFAQNANLLLLDEPTNHLDMSSVESLIVALSEFNGTIAFVSHDRHFIDQLCTHVFVLFADGRSLLYEGKLSDYERFAAEAGMPHMFAEEGVTKSSEDTKDDIEPVKNDYQQRKDRKRQRQKLERHLKKCDDEMTQLRTKISDVQERLAVTDGTDAEALQSLHKEQSDLESRISEVEGHWMEAAEELENLSSDE